MATAATDATTTPQQPASIDRPLTRTAVLSRVEMQGSGGAQLATLLFMYYAQSAHSICHHIQRIPRSQPIVIRDADLARRHTATIKPVCYISVQLTS